MEEFHLDLHGSGNCLFLLIDLNRVCITIIKLAPNVLNSYLLIFIHKFILFILDNKCYNYNYIYYVFIHVFIEISVFIGIYGGLFLVEDIYFNCISTVFIGLVFIADFIYLFPFIELDLIFFYSIHVL